MLTILLTNVYNLLEYSYGIWEVSLMYLLIPVLT